MSTATLHRRFQAGLGTAPWPGRPPNASCWPAGSQKGPSPRVREAALHVEQDACLIERIDANMDRAEEQGWRYADAGWMRSKRRRQATRYWLPL